MDSIFFNCLDICVTVVTRTIRFIRTLRKTRHCFSLTRETLLLCGFSLSAQLRENLFFAQDEQVLVFDLDFCSAVFAEQHAISNFYVQWMKLTLFPLAWSHGNHFALLLLFFGGVRDDDATLYAFFFFYAPHDHTVVERCKIHCHLEKTSVGKCSGLYRRRGN